jgi:outer membrane protein assembly complex protein YaeT
MSLLAGKGLAVRLALAVLLLSAASCAGPVIADLGPRARAADLKFDGAKSFSRDELLLAIEADLQGLERKSSPRSVVDDAAYSLEQFYVGQGFAEVHVDYTFEEKENKLTEAKFVITEGPRTILSQVEFVGRSRLSREELLLSIGLPEFDPAQPRGADPVPIGPAPAKPKPKTPNYFVERVWRDAPPVVAAAYVGHGFLDVHVDEPQIELDADHTHARGVLHIEEGRRYVLGSRPKIEGGFDYVNRQLDVSRLIGEPYAPEVRRSLRLKLIELYGWYGHPDAKVTVTGEQRSPDGTVELTFAVEEGPKVTIHGIRIEGNERTKGSRIMQELTLHNGDVWDSRQERESFRRIHKTALFNSVKLHLEPPEGEERELVITVVEAPSSELYFEPGYGSYEGFRALAGWKERNLLGTGRSLEVEGLLAQRAQRGLIRFGQPHVFEEVAGTLSFFDEHRLEPSFESNDIGAALGLARELTELSRISAEYRFRRSEISNADVTSAAAQQALQDVDISSVQISPTWDTRSNPLAPRDGTLTRFLVEYAAHAIGSEIDFARFAVSHARFYEMRQGTVLAMSARMGVIAPFGSTSTIPLQERYYNGGENSVRSFKENELGPKDSHGNPLGGEAFDVVSVEVRQQLRGNIEGALFTDWGNVVDDYNDYFQFPNFRGAIGVGLRYRLPIGPVRVDAGWNPDPRPDEDSYAVHFSVGMSF